MVEIAGTGKAFKRIQAADAAVKSDTFTAWPVDSGKRL